MARPLMEPDSPWLAVAPRAILHVDMDAFYASVEQLDDPSLRGRPVLVGGTGGRGVVCAASYEARPFGCRSAMPMATAIRLCPRAAVVKPRFARYHEISGRVREMMESLTPRIEPLSLDEAFLDVSGSIALKGEPDAMGREIRARVKEEIGITCSVGVAPNKFLAKLASDMDKPDGLTVLGPARERIQEQIDPLPIGRVWGVGKKTEPKLLARGWRTFRDVRAAGVEALRAALGDFGEHCWRLCQGLDDREVVGDREAKSIGHEETFFEDIADAEELRALLLAQVEHVARRLRRHSLKARTVSLKLRSPDFRTISRATTMRSATDETLELWHAAEGVFKAWATSKQFGPLRLMGVHLSGIEGGAGDGGAAGEQLGLFGSATTERSEKRSRLDHAADAIAQKFGSSAIQRAGAMRKPRAAERKDASNPTRNSRGKREGR